MQSNQFSYNAALRLQSGELVFGGIKGFNVFYPAEIQARNHNPSIVVTDLRINNGEVYAGSRYIASANADKIESVTIPYNDAVLSVDFAALEYSAPGKISYAYHLEGWDKGWNHGSNSRTANYTKLSEGNYTLRIRSTNAEGVWNPNELQLKVRVLPPWYRSWWAYVFYALLIGGTIALYLRYRAYRARLTYEVKIANLNAQKEKAERETERVIAGREKEIAEKRAAFFTNVSHEFRTPVTLIINPIRDLLNKQGQTTAGSELSTVYQNARRLLRLVDQLLLFRKAEAGADSLKVVKLDFCRLCKEIYLAFVQQAETQQIAYSFDCAAGELKIYADREKLEIILYNLLSNAFKYTPQGGRVVFAVKETPGEAEVVISDSGYGIPDGVGDKLFERYYQVRDKNIPAQAGFGIGLYLVKHFMDIHKGTIRYESELGRGTSFFLCFRKGKDHFPS